MEIVTSWMERGIEQGKQQGEVALILRQLNRRFRVVTPEVEARIPSLSVEQLENLGEALLDFADAADLSAWLEQKGIKEEKRSVKPTASLRLGIFLLGERRSASPHHPLKIRLAQGLFVWQRYIWFC